MDLGAVLFGGLSLLAFLRKKSSAKSNVDDDVTSNSNLDGNITFLTDTEYQNYLDKIEQDKYNDYLTKKAEEEAKKAEEEAKKAEEEERNQRLKNFIHDFNLNNEDVGKFNIYYPKKAKFPSYCSTLNKIEYDRFYNFSDDETLAGLGVVISTGNVMEENIRFIDKIRTRILPVTWSNVMVGETYIDKRDRSLISYKYEIFFYIEVVNPTDSNIYISSDNFQVRSLVIANRSLYPFIAGGGEGFPSYTESWVVTSRGPKLTLDSLVHTKYFNRKIENSSVWDNATRKFFGFTAIDSNPRDTDKGFVVEAKSNRLFWCNCHDLTTTDKLKVEEGNSMLEVSFRLYGVRITGDPDGSKIFTCSMVKGKEPSIIDNYVPTYYDPNLDLRPKSRF